MIIIINQNIENTQDDNNKLDDKDEYDMKQSNISSDNVDSKFIDWLKQKHLTMNTIKKLIQQYNSMYVLCFNIQELLSIITKIYL